MIVVGALCLSLTHIAFSRGERFSRTYVRFFLFTHILTRLVVTEWFELKSVYCAFYWYLSSALFWTLFWKLAESRAKYFICTVFSAMEEKQSTNIEQCLLLLVSMGVCRRGKRGNEIEFGCNSSFF